MGPLEVLQWLPADVEDVTYTDWAGIRNAAGLIGAGAEVRDELFLELLDQHSAQSWFAGPQRLSHLEAWGFDGANADWELTATFPGGAVVYVVALGADEDWASIIGLFEERGYSAEQSGEAVLRTVDRDLFIDWQAASDSAMLNVATIDAMRLLVMSDEMPDVAHLTDALTTDEFVSSRARAEASAYLDGTLSGGIVRGGERCVEIGLAPLLPPDVAAEYLRGLLRYEVMGGGYFVVNEEVRVRAVLTFADPADAVADATMRGPLAAAWGETSGQFKVADAEISESSVILELEPAGGPTIVLDEVLYADGYSGCP